MTRSPDDLPVAQTSFVGRTDDLKVLAAELRDDHVRLVTLTGVGGVGKSRLAVEATRRAVGGFPDGVGLVELATVASADSVADAVADALGVRDRQGMPLRDAIVDRLRSDRALVVVDNCEHVLDVTAALVGCIVAHCPTVTVLATSREPLGLQGERVRVVRPLDPAFEGVELFCDRALAADADFALGDDGETVRRLCERLDGLPLAIELAAARVRAHGPGQLLDRTDDRYRLLRAPRRDGLARHRTLLTTVEWSYELLDADAQELFDRLSVFPATFDLAAATAVSGGGAVGGTAAVADRVAALVDKSLVSPIRTEAGERYRLLETLRDYGRRQLDARGETAEIRDRHLTHQLAAARAAQADYEGRDYDRGRAAFDAAWDDLRAALEWALLSRRAADASVLIGASASYAISTSRREHGAWAERVRLVPGATADAWGAAALGRYLDGQFDDALELGERGLTYEPSLEHPDRAQCWWAIALANYFSGRFEEARRATRGWVDAARRDAPFGRAIAAIHRAVTLAREDASAADGQARAARSLAARLDNPSLDCWLDHLGGAARLYAGDGETAMRLQARASERADACGNDLVAGTSSLVLVEAATKIGRAEPRLWSDSVRRLRAIRHWLYLWMVVESLSRHWWRAGRTADAAVLFGFLDRREHHPAYPPWRGQDGPGRMDGPALRTAIDRGSAMDRNEVIDFILGRLDGATAADAAQRARPPARGLPELTRRENEVLDLVARGGSNKDIARELVLSVRTVENHLSHVYAKLGVSGRMEAALAALGRPGEDSAPVE